MADPTLTADVGIAERALPASDAPAHPVPFLAQIEAEHVLIESVDPDPVVWYATRGVNGTFRSAHPSGAVITPVVAVVQTGDPASPPVAEGSSAGFALGPGATIGTDGSLWAEAHSYQPVGPDLNLDPAAGSDDDPKYLAAVMGNAIGDALTKLKTYVGGLIGKYSVTGSKASSYPHAAVIAEVGDGTTGADAAVMAVLGGDLGVTTAGAAFGVDNQNSSPGSKVTYGLDLRGTDHDGYGLLEMDHGIRFADGTTQDSAGGGSVTADQQAALDAADPPLDVTHPPLTAPLLYVVGPITVAFDDPDALTGIVLAPLVEGQWIMDIWHQMIGHFDTGNADWTYLIASIDSAGGPHPGNLWQFNIGNAGAELIDNTDLEYNQNNINDDVSLRGSFAQAGANQPYQRLVPTRVAANCNLVVTVQTDGTGGLGIGLAKFYVLIATPVAL